LYFFAAEFTVRAGLFRFVAFLRLPDRTDARKNAIRAFPERGDAAK
jgi:hypothetical protein